MQSTTSFAANTRFPIPKPLIMSNHLPDNQINVDDDGVIRYFKNGRLHRMNGPAVEAPDGSESWCVCGQLHRLNGPAVIDIDGSELWYQNNLLHRTDGPAVIHFDGSTEWWIEGDRVSGRLEFKFLTGATDKFINDITEQYGDII